MVRKVSTHTWNPIIFQDRTLRGTDGDHVVPWFCRVFFTRPSMVPHGFPQFFPNLTSKPLVLLHVASMCETRRSSAGSLRPQAPILHSSSAIRTAQRVDVARCLEAVVLLHFVTWRSRFWCLGPLTGPQDSRLENWLNPSGTFCVWW